MVFFEMEKHEHIVLGSLEENYHKLFKYLRSIILGNGEIDDIGVGWMKWRLAP